MDKQAFKDWFVKGNEVVKNAQLPQYLYKDEMVQFNIIMYSFFNQLIIAQSDNLNSTFGELNYIFHRIVMSSQIGQDFNAFADKFANRYEQIQGAIDEIKNDEGIKNLEEGQKLTVVVKEIMRMVGTASELSGEEHLRISDMYLLCIQIGELLKFDFNYINYLTGEAVKEIIKQLEAYNKQFAPKTEEVKEESGEAEKNPTNENN